VYYAGWTEGHSRGVQCILGLGDWDDEESPEERRSFGIRCWVDGADIKFEVQDPAASRYGENTFLGRMLSRSDALADSEMLDVLHIAEHIVEDDPRVCAALEGIPQRSNGG
jgi:hypothetical protein